MHAGELISGEAGAVGLEGEYEEIEHRADEVLRSVVVGSEREAAGVDLWLRHFEPGGGALHLLLYLTYGREILVELFLVGFAELRVQRARIIEQKVEMTAGHGVPAALGLDAVLVQSEEPLEDE